MIAIQTPPIRRSERDTIGDIHRASRPKRLRSMRQFATEEIVIPTVRF